MPLISSFFCQFGRADRTLSQCLTIPRLGEHKSKKTHLCCKEPPEDAPPPGMKIIIRMLLPDIKMPFCVTSRRSACEQTGPAASDPSPYLTLLGTAQKNRSVPAQTVLLPSEMRLPAQTDSRLYPNPSVIRSKNIAFNVLPGSILHPIQEKYIISPTTVKANDVAM